MAQTTADKAKKVKKPVIIIIYNGKDVTNDLSDYIISLRYTDYEKDQSDELEIELKDGDDRFKGEWRPKKGDKIIASIGYTGEKLLNCGTFTVDESTLDSDEDGDTFTIRALAASINNKIREKNSKPYENKTLVDIARAIGKKHGFKVAGSEGFLKVGRVTQYKESDLAFLHRISITYGYVFKLTDNTLTFTRQESLDSAKPLTTLTKKDIKNITISDTATKSYNRCSVKYRNPKTGKIVSTSVETKHEGVKNETLKINKVCGSKEEAKAVAAAGLRNGSKTITGNLTIKRGNPYCIAGANYDLQGYKSFDTKYHIKQSAHNVTLDDWVTSCEFENAG